MKDSAKALEVSQKIKDRNIYAVRRQSVTNSEVLSMKDKLDAYRKLLLEYPEDKESLEFVIKNAIAWVEKNNGESKK